MSRLSLCLVFLVFSVAMSCLGCPLFVFSGYPSRLCRRRFLPFCLILSTPSPPCLPRLALLGLSLVPWSSAWPSCVSAELLRFQLFVFCRARPPACRWVAFSLWVKRALHSASPHCLQGVPTPLKPPPLCSGFRCSMVLFVLGVLGLQRGYVVSRLMRFAVSFWFLKGQALQATPRLCRRRFLPWQKTWCGFGFASFYPHHSLLACRASLCSGFRCSMVVFVLGVTGLQRGSILSRLRRFAVSFGFSASVFG